MDRRISTSSTSSRWRPRSDAAAARACARPSTRCRAMRAATPTKLADAVARGPGVHIVAATGLHHERFYGPSHWSHRATVDELADLFVADIAEGIDANDYAGPVVRRTRHPGRASIKIAGSQGGPSARDRRSSRPPPRPIAAPASRSSPTARAAPARSSRSALLDGRSASPPAHISLSHVDKVVDRGYHREIAVDRRVRRVRPGVPLGRRRRTARSAARAGWSRTAMPIRSCSAWTPPGGATTGSFGGSARA